VTPLATLRGYGLSSDAFHETAPDPTGAGVARCLQAALEDAGLTAAQIGYVNAHGTGTAANDPAEWRAVQRVFGDRLPAVSSTKSFLGHAQGAAGALEAIATIFALRHQQVPPTLHFVGPRLGCPADPVADARPRAWPHDHALCANSAFGGANAAVVLSRETPELASAPGREPAPGRARREVRVLGLGAVGAHGTTLGELARALEQGRPLDGRVPDFALESLARGVSTRGMDPATRYLTGAAARALSDAGVRLRGPLRERAGIVVGATSVSVASAREFLGSIAERGLARVSATAFAKMVLNAAAGACSMHLALKGPVSALTVGTGSGLAAVAYGAHLLAARGDADLLICGGVDERGRGSLQGLTEVEVDAPFVAGEGAGCLLLSAGAPVGTGAHPAVTLAGWGLAGPDQPRVAVEQALSGAGLAASDLERVYGHGDEAALRAALAPGWPARGWQNPAAVLGVAPAASSALACVAAVGALRRGEARTALVLSLGGGTASTAVLFTRGGSHGS
jgi:3-oxoacyl-[acyl-carrier-protein] synthase II